MSNAVMQTIQEAGYAPVRCEALLPCPFCGSAAKLAQLAHTTRSERIGRRCRMSVKHHLILIGCVKTKNKDLFGEDSKPNQAARCTPAELYASQLFKFRRSYAEERGLPWAVLSAKYGIWWPATLNRPYDQTFADMNEAERLAWHSSVCHLLVEQLWEPFNLKQADGPIKASELTIEFHAGADYCHPVAEMLQALGINVLLPMAGKQIGEQLAWYSENTPRCAKSVVPRPEDGRESGQPAELQEAST